MARWAPDNAKIGKAELLGRRLFPRPSLAGATDQRPVPSIDIRNFEESRDGGEVSLDRLGRTSAERQVLNYLTPRAEAASISFTPKRIFNGWACIQAKLLIENNKLRLDVIPSPIAGKTTEPGENDLSENIYHAHLQPHGTYEPYFIALHLQSQFEKHGRIEYSPNDPQKPSRLRSVVLYLSNALRLLSEKL
jgi:hypothetical protein